MHNENNETSTTRQSSEIELRRFGERVREVVGSNSARSFARDLNISDNILRKYMDGKSDPSRANLIAIARLGGVNLEWLSTGDGPKFPNEVEQPYQHQVTEGVCGGYIANRDFLSEFALIPGYSVQVSAGWGSEGSDEVEPSRHLAFRKRWLKWRGFAEKDLVVVWAKGDSMEPIISNNNTLLINMQRTELTDGNIFVIRNENQLWVKRVQVMPNAWRLLSDNKLYDPIEVPMDEQHGFQVVGQVVHISKDIGD
ncbi:helix-turn-helix transcriptional regulator [Shewanella sp. SM101]|uniref:XRE family transcriptional regulator n=1 Tax=Shewanella sp. SM101 TaxID=2912789 RepID=UPI0021D80F44|nr:helix-turn-helix transcriptional regulator [Shewanella sp. SM101]MCU8103488.1 helix-turn-helix transcriptional regulator [Shewanella sp. SM101]